MGEKKITFNIDETLYNKMREYMKSRGYTTDSEFIREAIRDKVLPVKWREERRVK